jgi:tetratricopeptide (TPR) repeat protein
MDGATDAGCPTDYHVRQTLFPGMRGEDEFLVALRAEYANKSAEERRMAADSEYHSAIAGRTFNEALARVGQAEPGEPYWPVWVLSLAVDPLFAPAILTVGSVEYQLGCQDEAIELFLTLTTLSADEPDLMTIIDKAGNFLLDAEDYERARSLYTAAGKAFPRIHEERASSVNESKYRIIEDGSQEQSVIR